MRKLLVFILLFVTFSCGNRQINETPSKPVDNKALSESLEKANRYLIAEEEEEIENYVRRHKLDMIKTGTGLRYQIMQHGNGKQVEHGQLVTLQYDLLTITDDLVYSSKTDGEKRFMVGNGEVESGLHELMPLLHVGDVVKAILPSHLAYGLTGDQNRIQQYTTMVYNIKVVNAE